MENKTIFKGFWVSNVSSWFIYFAIHHHIVLSGKQISKNSEIKISDIYSYSNQASKRSITLIFRNSLK